MLRSTIRFFPKSKFPFSIFFCSPYASVAAVAHDEPSNPTASSSQFFPTKNEAVSKLLLFLFSTVSIKAPSITKLRGDLPLEAWVSGVNASEMEGIVELLRRKKPQLALDFFFLSKNKYGFKHSMSCHLIIAHVLAGRQRLRGLKFHLQEMVKEQDGSMEEGLKLASDMEMHGLEPDLVTYNIIAKGFHSLGNVSEAFRLMDEMRSRGIQIPEITYSMLLHSLCKSGFLDDALNLFHEIEADGLEPDIVMYSILIHALCKQGRVHKAVQLYKEMCLKKINPNSFAHRSILFGLCENGLIKEARKYFDVLTNDDLMDDIVLYNIMIDRYVKHGDVREAGRLYEYILKRGITPSTITFNSMIYGLCKARKAYGKSIYSTLGLKRNMSFLLDWTSAFICAVD